MSWRDGGGLASIPEAAIGDLIAAERPRIVERVGETYAAFYAGAALNPDTYSLKFPTKPGCRINALPAWLAETDLAGMKWVASFPGNVGRGLLRATATIVLNCGRTGYPIAFLDGTRISAARTAASAALAARLLRPERTAERLQVFGAGVINRDLVDFLVDDGWRIGRVLVADPARERAGAFAVGCAARGLEAEVEETPSRGADLVALATNALDPWYDEPISPDAIVLHMSLRDIVPERLAPLRNVVDDVDHALKAQTSLHRLEQAVGRTFRVEDFGPLLRGEPHPGAGRGAVVAAFGMGILDLAVADLLLEIAHERGLVRRLDGLVPAAAPLVER